MRNAGFVSLCPIAWILILATPPCADGADPSGEEIRFENRHLVYAARPHGTSARFADVRDGKDYAVSGSSIARIKKGGQDYGPSRATRDGDRLTLEFGGIAVRVLLQVSNRPRYLVFEVADVQGDGIQELTFFDQPLTLKGSLDEPFAACALALDLKTNVSEIPGPSSILRATCYPRIGMVGARVAILGCPTSELRELLQQVVSDAPDLPHTHLGGPWALDAPMNKGSYLFNFGGLSEKTVDQWIDVAHRTGMNQIDFHGGNSFRFGDIRLNPETYPNGTASLKAVIDKLHAAGIAAGLHTYAFFIDKKSRWVSPVPDPRLAKDAKFTLAESILPDAAAVLVVESTEKMSTLTGFFIWNSITLQIDDELITYGGVSKSTPFVFTQCKRGTWGTTPARHAKGAKVQHLKECFGLFVPDGDSTLLSEVAARTAEVFNDCGFDMIYLDALDGEGILGGPELAWHYGSKFVYEIYKNLKRPPLMEMSTFHHHLWCVRSRYGAWDFPNRGHKKFIDIHCAANADARRMFLPAHLGWWSVKTWGGLQDEPTYADDIEYLCCKCIGNDVGFSLQGVNPDTIAKVPAYERLSAIMRQYEELRRSDHVPETIKAKLRVPGDEFTLTIRNGGGWSLRPVRYDKHKVEGLHGPSNRWRSNNALGAQPLQVRIEALLSAVPYDSPQAQAVADFKNPAEWPDRAAAPGFAADLRASVEPTKTGDPAACLTAGSAPGHASQPASATPTSWTRIGRTYPSLLSLKDREGLGVWVYGDGLGEVLNFQLRSPEHLISGYGDHIITIDFTGWRYFELMELDSVRTGSLPWPYAGNSYAIYREMIHYDQIEALNIWCTHLPPGKTAKCCLGPIKSLPLLTPKLTNPSIMVAGKSITFPVSMETGSYLECRSESDCKLYARDGRLISNITPQGPVPTLQPGPNDIAFRCEPLDAGNPRAYVTLITQGEKLRE